MNFIKKHLMLIIITSVVIIVGMGLFVLGKMMSAANKKNLSRIKSEYSQAAGLAKEVIHQNVLDDLQNNVQLAQEDEKRVTEIVRQTSRRPLLFEKIFPEPKEISSARSYYNQFGQQYCQAIENLLRVCHSGDKPSVIEEQKVLESYRGTASSERGNTGSADARPATVVPPGGMMPGGMPSSDRMPPGGMPSSDGMPPGGMPGGRATIPTGRTRATNDQTNLRGSEQRLVDELRRKRAQNISVYTNTDALCCYDYWQGHPGTGEPEALSLKSWFSQISYWIQQDVVLSVAKINDNSKSVLENPVKRLVEIGFSGESAGESAGRKDSTSAGSVTIATRKNNQNNLPQYVIRPSAAPGQDAAITPPVGAITSPWTGRAGDELIDVVHFSVSVIINTTRMADFINAMQSEKYDEANRNRRNQITVLDMQVEPLDIEAEQAAGFHYGPGSLTLLRLNCEYFFFRSGYEEFKPEAVKKLLVSQER